MAYPRIAARRARPHTESVVDQVVIACSSRNLLATSLAFVLAGVVPVATYVEAHYDLDPSLPLLSQPATYMVAGGLIFSAKTVFAWAKRAFRDGWKALGFVVLLEGVMVTSSVPVLPLVLLTVLVAINGLATGCILSLDRTRPKATPATPRESRREIAQPPAAVAVPAPTSRKGARRVTTPAAPAMPESSRALPAPAPQGRFSFAEGTDVN